MAVVSMKELLEAGVHFGHQTRRWNPKMKRFIFTERGGIYIIDLQQTQQLLEEAHDFARNIAERNGTILFVGTKKQAQDAVRTEAERVGMPFVANRWLGGLLTNWRTISDRIAYLHDLRRLKTDGQLELLPAKERITMEAELEKLEANLGGVADMRRQPDAIFIVDLKKEALAVREAQRLHLPVIALVDTNCDPDEADFVIPGNDDAIRSCSLIVRAIADGIAAGRPRSPRRSSLRRRRRAGTNGEVRRLRAPMPPSRHRSRKPAEEAPQTRRRAPEVVADVEPSRAQIRRRGGRGRRGGTGMTEISASLVKELRELTGAGMMDCKRALQDTGGDIDAARTLLREKGMALAGNEPTGPPPRASSARSSTARRPIVGVGCETEPVSKNEEFQSFAERVLRAVHERGTGAVESFDEERLELLGKLGENIVVAGTAHYDDGGTIAQYVHPPANKIGVLVQLDGGSTEPSPACSGCTSSFAPTRVDDPRPRCLSKRSRPSGRSI